jgi:ribosomal protein L12E/L44/L45/RPP1/RPP2
LVFLGSWRSTLIICVSIPLSILTSVLILSALGETINIMTLGGLALAVGILVDDATVEIENIERQLGLGKDLRQAILDGAQSSSAATSAIRWRSRTGISTQDSVIASPPDYLVNGMPVTVQGHVDVQPQAPKRS